MKVDALDNTLICENDDLQTSLSYIKDNRELPEKIEKAIINVIFDELGLKFDEKQEPITQLDLLPKQFIRNTVRDINYMFSTNKLIDYNNQHLSYLMYYLPINTFKVWKPLLDLHIQSALKSNMKILDIGTGPGSIPLGVIEFYKSLAILFHKIEFSLDFVLIDSEHCFIKLAKKMIDMMKMDLPSNLSINVQNSICTKVTIEHDRLNLEKFDIITMSNFITTNEDNNSKHSYDIIKNFKNNLQKDGSIIIIEPGDEVNCIELKTLRNRLINNKVFNLYSPCISIWDEKDTYNCSCFSMTRSYWEIPRIFDFLKNNGLLKRLRKDIPFNYIVLRMDELKKYQPIKNSQYFTKFSKLDSSIGSIVNITAFIRTVIYNETLVNVALCDGSCSIGGDFKGVWIKLSTNQLMKLGINTKLVAGERIKLMKVEVNGSLKGITLQLTKQSQIMIEY